MPNNKSCNTPKVLEIHNHECPVLFHRVVVPAAIGDDEANPPRNGQHRNVLLVYEANGHVYLFSSDGIPTFISDGKTGGVEDYEELLNKPLINGHELIGDSSLEDIGVDDAIDEALNEYTPTDELADVALSGDYNDLSNTPTIPTVNDATLTVSRNNSPVGAFTANSATDTTIDIAVPTKTSDLTNDSGFITNSVSNLTNYYTKSQTYTQGEVNSLLSAITIPTKTSDLTNDGADGTSTYVEADDLATVATSGSYNDLSDKPTIGNATLTIQRNGTSAGTFTANATSNKSINITVPTTAADVSALPASTKYGASIAVSINTADYKVTTTLKDQDGNTLGTAQVIDLPLESVVVNGSYDSTNKKIVLTLQSGSTIDIPVADLVAGLQSEITSTNKLSSDLVDDTNHTHKFVTAAQITKLNGIATGAEVNQNAFSNVKVGTTTVAADAKTDTLELVAGSNVTITPDATNDKVTIAATNTTYDDATTTAHGLMTAADKVKLNGIATGAEVNVQSDWSVTDSSSDAFIKNKPTIPTVNNGTLTIQKNGTSVATFTANQSGNSTANITVPTKTSDLTNNSDFVADANYVHTDNNYTTTEKNKLSGIAAGAEVNVQANWAQTTTTADDYIKNKPTIPTVNNGQLTIQKNGTNVATFTANQSGNATANITVPTNTNELTNGAGFITSSGTAAKANQLTTARTIAIGTGATGTATSFNGTSNITIPITDVKDAYVTWGGRSLASDITPDDMGCIDEFGHNKLAFLPAECIEIKYSTDGGSTWTDYGASDANKVKMVSTAGPGFYVGGSTNNATASNIANLKLRVRIAAGPTSGGKVYTAAKKILINVSTQGCSGNKVDIKYRTIANYKAGTETWTTVGTYDVAGGSGWNSIPFAYTFGGSFTSQTSQMGQIEFVFYSSGLGTWGLKKLSAIDFRMIGSTNWAMPSEMARAGHLYKVDENQNATFPANVSVTGSLKHGNYTYTLPNKNGTVAMTSDIPSVPTVNNGQLTIQKNGSNVATFTANQSGNSTANITVPTTVAELSDAGNYATNTALNEKQDTLTAGSHISISNDTISATGYVHSENPVTAASSTATVTGSMIANGTITSDKLATGATLKLTLSTTDIGEGAALAANTLYGVYQ